MNNRINTLNGKLHRLASFPRRKPWSFGTMVFLAVALTVWGIFDHFMGLVFLGLAGIGLAVGLVIFVFNKIMEENL